VINTDAPIINEEAALLLFYTLQRPIHGHAEFEVKFGLCIT
jgi:hypothetical protein